VIYTTKTEQDYLNMIIHSSTSSVIRNKQKYMQIEVDLWSSKKKKALC